MPRPSTGPRSPAPGGPDAGATGARPEDSIAARVTGLGSTERLPANPPRLFLAAAYALGLGLGFVLGLYGVVWVPEGLRLGGAFLSAGLLLALVGNTAVALLVRWLTGTRLGALVVLIGWAPVVLALGSSRPEGDLMLRATTTGYLFLALGALAPVTVAVVGTARRGLTAFTLPPPGSSR
ncbi:hypothetical protein I6A60_17530 [Frankia sp. AgB1.9]|uniref:DUF6113 family protein n=1 Tax=unclassified Frankia TaxID=2632575 RepID=UPI0019338DF9|nr:MULTISPECIES: DUF6113 family protein [unclassified Frankia]MBL7492723.1 hypothetical protein [Frankia sp. AgW1.1]MBL7549662.1 hypothetical protein [Frankia sp. AgB1.9]MBL7623119.1 hypothetical protein [Frankia sp. AgB1.8]